MAEEEREDIDIIDRAEQGLRINVETLLRRTVSTPKLNNC